MARRRGAKRSFVLTGGQIALPATVTTGSRAEPIAPKQQRAPPAPSRADFEAATPPPQSSNTGSMRQRARSLASSGACSRTRSTPRSIREHPTRQPTASRNSLRTDRGDAPHQLGRQERRSRTRLDPRQAAENLERR